MKRIVLTFVFLSACTPVPPLRIAGVGSLPPAWLEKPDAGCSADELCAVGEGTGRNAAGINARLELAKILETKIDAVSAVSETETEAGLSQNVTERTDFLLNTAEIRETFEGGKSVYALAVLNKPLSAAILKKDIEKLDENIKDAVSRGSLPDAVKAERAAVQRKSLNAKYAVLTGDFLPEKVSYADVLDCKRKATEGKVLFVRSESPLLTQSVRSVLEQAGYALAGTGGRQAVTLDVLFSSGKQHLNVKGFVRYLFNFRLVFTDAKGVRKETAVASFSETGRTYGQAFEYAAESYRSYLAENIPSF